MTILSNGHQWKYSEFIDNKDYSFDKDQIFFLLNKLRRVRNKAEEFGAFLPLPKGVYVMRGGRLGYDPKRAED